MIRIGTCFLERTNRSLAFEKSFKKQTRRGLGRLTPHTIKKFSNAHVLIDTVLNGGKAPDLLIMEAPHRTRGKTPAGLVEQIRQTTGEQIPGFIFADGINAQAWHPFNTQTEPNTKTRSRFFREMDLLDITVGRYIRSIDDALPQYVEYLSKLKK